MNTPAKYFDPLTLAKIRTLGLRARYLVEGYVAGMHRSPHQGRSIEFSQHREYTPGDDLRQVDWKVFARTDKYYVKQFEDETNLIGHLLLDSSESMAYRGPESGLSKFEYAQVVAFSLAYLVLSQQDSVGLSTIVDRVVRNLPDSGSPAQLQNIIQILEQTTTQGKTRLATSLREVAGRLRRRGIVMVLSDGFDDIEPVLQGLKHLRHAKHDVIFIQILDRAELTFPFKNPVRFIGLEGWPSLTADPLGVRKAYRQAIDHHVSTLRQGCRSLEIDFHQLVTDQPIHLCLPYLLAHRAMQRR